MLRSVSLIPSATLLLGALLSCAPWLVANAADGATSVAPQPSVQATPASSPPPLPGGVTRGATIEGVEEFHLANGLTVLLAPDPGKPTITVNVTYRVGSRLENYGETGMAHLLEHMLFKGTPRSTGIMGELTRHGANFNGTTAYDRTNYFETVAATDENLRVGAGYGSRPHGQLARVARQDLDSEMTVVRNEIESGENSPDGSSKRAVSPPPSCGTAMAQPHRLAQRHREGAASSACKPSTATTTSPITPCWWWPDASTSAPCWRASTTHSAAFRAQHASCRAPIRSTRCRKANVGGPAPSG